MATKKKTAQETDETASPLQETAAAEAPEAAEEPAPAAKAAPQAEKPLRKSAPPRKAAKPPTAIPLPAAMPQANPFAAKGEQSSAGVKPEGGYVWKTKYVDGRIYEIYGKALRNAKGEYIGEEYTCPALGVVANEAAVAERMVDEAAKG